jgi:hypothetical protein
MEIGCWRRFSRDCYFEIAIPASYMVDEIRWDENAGLRRDATRSQVIDALEAQEIKETGNEED